MNAIQAAELAHQIADRACIADIESECTAIDIDGRGWWDSRCMTDPRELPDDFVEMARQALAYAEWRGLFTRHPAHPHLLRINPEHTP